MRLNRSSGSLRRLLAAGGLLCFMVGCGSAPGRTGGYRLALWASGPVRWLLLPDELRQLRRVESPSAAIRFIEDFWRRRDPDPGEPGNPVREAFLQRVEAADQLYGERGRRGSLSDRGGALILLGSPSHLHVTSRPALRWDLSENRPERVTTEQQSYEIWGYRLEDLPPALVRLVTDDGGGEEALRLQLSFVRGHDRIYLAEGGELLELAARALVMAAQ